MGAHAVVFPFMAKGHAMCLLQLTRLLLRRGIATTFVTTPANSAFVAGYLSDTSAAVVEIPFPENIPGIPDGVESTEKLPSMSLFFSFVAATKLMREDFERVLCSLLPVTFMVSDAFLGWTRESARKFGIARVVSYGISAHAMSVSRAVSLHGLLRDPELRDDEVITIPEFPRVRVTRKDFDSALLDPDPNGEEMEFLRDHVAGTSESEGVIVNSLYEMESEFVDYWNRESKPRAWCMGPLCLAEPPGRRGPPRKHIMEWLDSKLARGVSVLYVAFGSQAEIPEEQAKEMAAGLEESGVHFLWVARGKMEVDAAYEGRLGNKGLLVREWVDQRGILEHRCVGGFLSHCGWNSVMESLCAGVPLLAWPVMADQPLNARMVTEEMGVGLRVDTVDGSVRGFVRREGLARSVRELMEGDVGEKVRETAKKFPRAARAAWEDGGPSSQSLEALINHLRNNSARLDD